MEQNSVEVVVTHSGRIYANIYITTINSIVQLASVRLWQLVPAQVLVTSSWVKSIAVLHISFLQDTSVQSIVASDGSSSFAIFLYENPNLVVFNLSRRQVGFDAGDGSRRNLILDINQNETTLSKRNIFRIDG